MNMTRSGQKAAVGVEFRIDGVPGCLPEFRGLEHFHVVGKPAEFIGAGGLGFGKAHVDGLEEGDDIQNQQADDGGSHHHKTPCAAAAGKL